MGAQHADRGTSTAGTLGTTDTDCITITGAREHNLKDVDVEIPKGRITVFTGVSGSGKSSLVFDTVAVESQRQLNETYTWYVRNQLPKHERPKADTIERLAPAIVVDQRPVGGGARSTVGTMTDIHAVLRVLFSRCGTPSAGEATAYSFNDPAGMCPECAGLGRTTRIDLDRFLDTGRSLNEARSASRRSPSAPRLADLRHLRPLRPGRAPGTVRAREVGPAAVRQGLQGQAR